MANPIIPKTNGLPSIKNPGAATTIKKANVETPYQSNLSQPAQPEKWYKGDKPTTYEIYGQIGRTYQSNPEAATQYLKDFRALQSDPTSRYYDPYTKPTNKAVGNISQYGVDVSNINDDWRTRNGWLKGFYLNNGTTNSPSKPGKGASAEEYAAYEYYQIDKAWDTTEKAQNEWAALQEELSYWAKAGDRNYTDDEIVERTYGKNGEPSESFKKKYPTLYAMDEGRKAGIPVELNTPVGYSYAGMYGTLWNARNGNSVDNPEVAIVYSAMGAGNQYQENPELRAKLDPKSESYSPYSVGSTLEAERVYFNMPRFDRQWCLDNRDEIYASGDATKIKMYENVAKAVEFTEKVQQERKDLYAEIDKRIGTYKDDPDRLLKRLKDNGDYKDLFDMDATMSGDNLMDTTLLPTSDAVDYRWQDVEKYAYDQAKKLNNMDTLGQSKGVEVSGTNTEIVKQQDAELNSTGWITEKYGTDQEKLALETGGSSEYMQVVNAMVANGANTFVMMHQAGDNLAKQTALNYKDTVATIYEYDQHAQRKEKAEETVGNAKLHNRLMTLRGKATMNIGLSDSQLGSLLEARDGTTEDGKYVKSILDKNPDDDTGLLGLYTLVTKESALNLNQEEMQAAMEQARQWWSSLQEWDENQGRSPFTDAEKEELERLEAWDAEQRGIIEEETAWMDEHQEEYDQAQTEKDRLGELWSTATALYAANGEALDSTMMANMENLYAMSQTYEPMKFTSASVWDVALEDGAMSKEEIYADARQSATECNQTAQQMREYIAYMESLGVTFTDEERKNMESHIRDVEENGKSASYVMLDEMPDFDERVREGVKILHDQGMDTKEGIVKKFVSDRFTNAENLVDVYSFLFGGPIFQIGSTATKGVADATDFMGISEDEAKRLAYLIACDEENGTNEAKAYVDFLMNETNGTLRVRGDEALRQEVRRMAESSGWGTLGVYAGTFGSNFAQPLFELSDRANRKILGKEEAFYGFNYAPRAITEEGRQVTLERLQDKFARSEGDKEAIEFLFGAFTSAVDSYINSQVVGPLAEVAGTALGALGGKLAGWAKGTKWGQKIISIADKAETALGGSFAGELLLEGGKKLGGLAVKAGSDFSSAVYMGSNAALSTYRQSILSGVDPDKAAQLAFVSFLAETVTEGITMGNIREAFAGGGTGAVNGIRDFVSALIKDGLEEAVGEGFGAWWESNAERIILGEYSDYEQTAQKYIDAGYPSAIAYQLADQEMWKGVMNEALSAFVSAGFTTGTATVGGIVNGSNRYMRLQEAEKNKVLPDTTGEQNYHFQGQAVTPVSQEEIVRRQEAQRQEEAQQKLTSDLTLLFNSQTATDATSATANIDAVLRDGGDHAASTAAAQALVGVVTKKNDKVDTYTAGKLVGDLLKGDPMNSKATKSAIIWAANTKGVANEMLLNAAQRVASGETLTTDDAKNIVSGMQADRSGAQAQMHQAVYNDIIRESRIANEENRLKASDAETIAKKKTVDAKEDALDQAREGLAKAKKQLTDAVNQNMANSEALKFATESIQTATRRAEADAWRQTRQQLREALKGGVASAANIMNQAVKQSQDAVDKAQSELDDVANEYETFVRQKAAANVDQQMAQEQAVAEQVAQEQAAQAEEQAKVQAEEDERSGKADEERTSALIEDLLNRDQLEGAERDEQRQKYEDMAEKIKLKKIDMTGLMNNAEGYLAMRKLERKLGIKVDFSDHLGNARGKYENGTVYLNSNLIKAGKMTIGQAVIEASLHEFTHSAENTGWYKQYADVVLHDLFRGKNGEIDQAGLKAALDQKIADYRRLVNQDLSIEDAQKEIVADYARTHLNSRDVVLRLCEEGLGGKIRNALHNINQAIKNYNLQGEEKVTAEYLRKAERLFQKTLDEVARTATHPEGGQFSVMQFAQAAGLNFDPTTRVLYDKNNNVIDGIKNKVTADMVDSMPVGMLINAGLSNQPGTDAEGKTTDSPQVAAKKMMAGLMNLVAQYKDSDLVWEIGATTLNSTFSAIKSNSDPQYKTTVDFGTVCAKTQAIVDVMSKVMKNKIDPETGLLKEGAARGLNRKDVLTVYNEVHKADLSVPCPVCYVFSRWMGVPSLLGQMSQYQNDYVVLEKDADGKLKKDKNGNYVVNKSETQKNVDKFLAKAKEFGDAKAINKRKATLQSKLTTLDNQHDDLRKAMYAPGLSAEEKANIQKQIDDVVDKAIEVENELGKVAAYNWITQALCKETSKGSGKFIVDDAFTFTPDEILFDLNKTGEFAGYTKNWAYRNTRGAGMGKAIMPYSGETIGDILYGVNSGNKGRRQSSIKNPWLNNDPKSAARQLKNAIDRAKKQNLVGGQRLQSTSDFRPEWGLDYIMSFLELQAAKSKVQMYTKVAEAVDFFASMGADVNLSIMGEGTGWHEATAQEIAKMTPEQIEMSMVDGKVYVMDFSNITGMSYYGNKNVMGAVDFKNKYDNVQMILVGMNDTHIRLAMKNSDIDFIIPWHSSGNSKDILTGLINAVGEKLKASVDYTTTQSDMVKGSKKSYYDEHGNKVEYTAPGKQTEDEKALWDARVKLLTKGGSKLTQAERETLLRNPFTADLYRRFTEKGYDDDCYNVKLTGDQAKQIFPYEYWDKTSTRENADVNGKRFVEYCEAMGIVPRFSQFKDDPGYWKLLIDRSMYNNNTYNDDGTVKEYGKYREQKIVDVTNTKIGALNDEGKLEGSSLPMQAQAKYAPTDPRSPNYEKYTKREEIAKENAIAELNKQYQDGSRGQFSVYGEMTLADMEQMLYDDSEYMDAVDRGDMDEAQRMADQAAEEAGFDVKLFHGTDDFGFTVINTDNSDDDISFFATDSLETANTYAWNEGIKEIKDRLPFTRKDLIDEIGLFKKDESILQILDKMKIKYEKDGKDEFGRETVYRVPEWDSSFKDNGHIYNVPYRKSIREIARELNKRYLSKDPLAGKTTKLKNGVYQLYTKSEKQLLVETNGTSWKSILWEDALKLTKGNAETASKKYSKGKAVGTTREIAKWAKDHGYDSVKITNIVDRGGKTPSYRDQIGQASVYIFFDPQNQIKSADPVTYDDNGNVIPLSERFNDQNNDIRYSAGGETTTADMEQALLESGAITREDLEAYMENGGDFSYSEPRGPQRQFGSQTAQRSDELSELAKNYLKGHSSYTPDTNQAQIERAVDWIKGNRTEADPDGYMNSIQKVTGKRFASQTPDGQARTLATMAMAVAKGDIAAQIMIADAYNREGTTAGQTLQARKIFRLMTPEGRIATLRKMLTDEQSRMNAKGVNVNLKFSDWIYRAAAAATEEGDFEKVQKAAAAELGEQLPQNWKDRLRSVRMLSMLGNPRTHIRNIIGNAMFIPAVSLKNKLGALGEIISRQDERTKTLRLTVPKPIRQFARNYANSIQDTLTGEAKYNDGSSMVRRAAKPFGNSILQKAIDTNGNLLEAEDWFFLKGHFRRALGGWMTANGYTVEQMQKDYDTLQKGVAYAVQEAQKATYRDASKIASILNKVSRNGGLGGFLVDAALPFKKTPANILKRGIEYSPASLLRSFSTDLYHMKQYHDFMNGKLSEMPAKAISPAQWIDRFCSGLSGTVICGLGMLLSHMGIVTVGLDDDDDKFEQAKGEQKYAVHLFGNDISFTMDWAAPISMPFFVGASVEKMFDDEGDFSIEGLVNSMANISEPVFNLSMLDGVNSLLKTNSYDDTNSITQILAKIGMNYVSSYVPSALGAVARTIDPYSRKSFVESGQSTGPMGTVRYSLEQMQNKIPGYNQENIPIRDIWGRPQSASLLERIAENFILPGYISRVENDPLINEMARVYEVVEDSALVPSDPPKSFKYKNESYVLNDKQWDAYKEARGQAAFNGLTELFNDPTYQNAQSEEVRAEMIKGVWSYADKIGKAAAVPEYDAGASKKNPIAKIAKDAVIGGYEKDMVDALDEGDYETYETMRQALYDNDVEDSSIKEKIGNTYRDQWKDAYKKNDNERMEEIEDAIFHSGYDINIYGKGGWQSQVDKLQEE
jgi:hypothetical protein